ncbi:MAG: hypothetical protein K1X88_20450 [Nannocystaceae bacterium]|nr:hypothetical protein [Nannocystaceae bacterium]
MPASDTRLLAAVVCSGFAALGYEIVWTRLCTPMLGSETLGVLATLAGFFGGMALGAALLHRRAVAGPDPIALFQRLELGAAAFAAVSPWLLHALGSAIPAWIGPGAGDDASVGAVAVAIAIAAALMIPGTLCMGATLAAVTEARRRRHRDDDDGRGVARLYAANTAGAVLGALVTVHAIVPAMGLGYGALLLAIAGVVAAALARSYGRAVPAVAGAGAGDAAPIDASRDPDPDAREPLPLHLLIFGAGVVGVGLEVAGTLVLSQVFENTIYTFANVLAVFLAGTAAGAWAWGARGPTLARGRPATAAAALLVALAVSTIVAAVALAQAPAIVAALVPAGAGVGSHQLAELACAAVVFGPPTLLMGALFSHAMGLVAPGGLGRAYALNTAGSALAPFLFGLWAPAQLGYRDGFYAVAWGYLAVFGVFTWFRRFRPTVQIGTIVATVAATALGPRSLVLVGADEGWTVLAQHESAMGLVVVSEQAATAGGRTPLRRLQVGKNFRMGGAFSVGERRMGMLPLVLAPAAARALYLGVGTGATLSAVRHAPQLRDIDAVELVPGILEELPRFAAINGDVAEDPRVRLHAADARRFVAASDDRYDLVVADLFHPGIDGAGSLYAQEHFEHIAAHLDDGGLFVQWLPLHQLDARTLPIVACTFAAVFPEAHGFLGIYNVQTSALALVGRKGGAPLQLELAPLEQRLRAPIFGELLMDDSRDLFAAHLLDPEGVATLCGDAPRNTDLRPWVTLLAPQAAYLGAGTLARDNLTTLLALRRPLDPSLVIAPTDVRTRWLAEVEDFAQALAAYLHGEIARIDAGEGAPLPEAAIAAYLQAYEHAPDFKPARGMLVQAARRSGELAERVLPAMLARRPDNRALWAAWLDHLRRSGDAERFEQAQAEAQAHLGEGSAPEPPAANPGG